MVCTGGKEECTQQGSSNRYLLGTWGTNRSTASLKIEGEGWLGQSIVRRESLMLTNVRG